MPVTDNPDRDFDQSFSYERVREVSTPIEISNINDLGVVIPTDHVVERACAINSAVLANRFQKSNIKYCIGFAAGADNKYKAHAWNKYKNQYFDVTPQDGILKKYLLVREMTMSELKAAIQAEGLSVERFRPPLVNATGELLFPI